MSAAVATAAANVRAQRLASVRAAGAGGVVALHPCPCLSLLPYPGAGPTVRAEGDGGTVF